MNTRRHRTRPIAAAAIAAAMVFAAGCAAGDDDAADAGVGLPTLRDDANDGGGRDESASQPGADGDDGSDGGDGSAGDGPDEDVDPEVAMAEYERCMRDQGIDLDIGSGGGAVVEEFEAGADDIDQDVAAGDLGGTAFEEFEAAAEACDPILEDAFGDFELTPEQEAEFADQMLELQRCLADRGFDIDVSGNAFQLDPDIDFEEFEAAMSECEPETQFGSTEVGP